MKRRSFVKASILTGAAFTATSTLSIASTDGVKKSALEFYELRVYTLSNDKQQKLVEDYYRKAAIPALNRLGLKAFTHMPAMDVPPAGPRIFELRQYQSASEAAGKKKIEMFMSRAK